MFQFIHYDLLQCLTVHYEHCNQYSNVNQSKCYTEFLISPVSRVLIQDSYSEYVNFYY